MFRYLIRLKLSDLDYLNQNEELNLAAVVIVRMPRFQMPVVELVENIVEVT